MEKSMSQRNFFYKKERCDYEPVPLEGILAGIDDKHILSTGKSVEYLKENFKCGICLQLLLRPVECHYCTGSFCMYCISKWKEKNPTCPNCRKKFDFKESLKTKKTLGKLKLACAHIGCKEKIDYADYYTHLNKCQFRKFYCTNENCDYTNILNEIKVHCKKCPKRKIYCEYCRNIIIAGQKEQHNKTECSAPIKCGLCRETMKRCEYFSNHKSENNENVKCLKTQLNNYKNKVLIYRKKLEEAAKKAIEDEKTIRELETENKKYKEDNNETLSQLKDIVINLETKNKKINNENNNPKQLLEINNIKHYNSKTFINPKYNSLLLSTPKMKDSKLIEKEEDEKINDRYLKTQDNFYLSKNKK